MIFDFSSYKVKIRCYSAACHHWPSHYDKIINHCNENVSHYNENESHCKESVWQCND